MDMLEWNEVEYPGDYGPRFDHERLDVEWAALSAIRETIGIARKGLYSPTYRDALNVGKMIAPELFDSHKTLIGRSSEPRLVQEYRQRAEAQSRAEHKPIAPLELLNQDIQKDEELLANAGEYYDLIQRRISEKRNVRQYFLPRKYTENELINRDVFVAVRDIEKDLPSPPITTATIKDYQLPNGRGLRLRMLHPNKPEHATGADLIYEMYWEKYQKVRICFVQYKVWNGEVLYTSQAANLKEQLAKMQKVVCENELCEPPENDPSRTGAYRLPFCAAFLRPTDKLQSPDSRLISSGLHLPVCVTCKAWEPTNRSGDGEKIERKKIRSQSLSPKVFEELLNIGMAGSRWLDYKEVERLYHQHHVLGLDETVILHAQEFDWPMGMTN